MPDLAVLVRQLQGLVANGGVHVAGDLKASARPVADLGWLLCDGASLLRADYPDLFAAIGITYGSADGTHFNVPDLRGRVPVGVDGAAGRIAANDALGQSAGAETVTLSAAESGTPAHSHGAGSLSWTVDFNATRSGGTLGVLDGNDRFARMFGGAAGGGLGNWTVNVANGSTANNAAAGAASAHNNLQPYQVVNWFVKT